MTFNSDIHHRRSIRLHGYDYTQAGAYFITICVHNRECLFGEVVDGEMRLNDAGRVVELCWQAIPEHFPHVELDAFVMMPNHLHGVVFITGATVGATHASPLQTPSAPYGPRRGSIAAIVGSFKSAATKRINEQRATPGSPLWQRNYYEHIIRDENSLTSIRKYIVNNPLQWSMDRENPANVGVTHAPPLQPWDDI